MHHACIYKKISECRVLRSTVYVVNTYVCFYFKSMRYDINNLNQVCSYNVYYYVRKYMIT